MKGQKLSAGMSAVLKWRLAQRLTVLKTLALEENDFAAFIREIELDPLFEKLSCGGPGAPAVIRRMPRLRLHAASCLALEEKIADGTSPGLPEMDDGLLAAIKKLGRENFEKYFLRCDRCHTAREISNATGITQNEARRLNELALKLSVLGEFSHPSAQPGRYFSILARVELDGAGNPLVYAAAPHTSRAGYEIDHAALKLRIAQKTFSKKERAGVDNLIRKISLANMRSDTVLNILEAALQTQKEFLAGGGRGALRVLTVRGLAKRLNLAPSTVSRAMANRAVVLPDGREAPLPALFAPKSAVLKTAIAAIPGWETKKISDGEILEILRRRFGIEASRRTVNYHRNKLGALR